MSEMILKYQFTFEAAHQLPHVPPQHKCRRLHGHSFHVAVRLKGPLDETTGWVCDFADIRSAVSAIIDTQLDHRFLNEVPGLENPTSENIAKWLWQRIKSVLPLLYEIEIGETCRTSCIFRG